jgi:anti-sigma B factor antagonist
MHRFTTPLLRVTPQPSGRGLQLALEGELDLATTPILEHSLEDAERDGEQVVALDLTELSFVDASGLKAILNAHRRAIRRGGPGLSLLNPSDDIRRLLELTAIDLTIEVRPHAFAA